LVEFGAYTLPSLRQEKKFTERYGKAISHLVETLDLPSFARLELVEDKPYDIVATLYIDYPSYLKSEEPSIGNYNNSIQARFKSLLENYLGVEFGNPVHGKINLNFIIKIENEDEGKLHSVNRIRALPERHCKGFKFDSDIVRDFNASSVDRGMLTKYISAEFEIRSTPVQCNSPAGQIKRTPFTFTFF
jgi:hypothetical protein